MDPSAPWDLVISALLFNVGFLQLAVLGKYADAAKVLQETHAIRKTLVGEGHSLTVQAAVSRGWALTLTGNTLLAVNELTRYICKELRGFLRLVLQHMVVAHFLFLVFFVFLGRRCLP